MFSFVTINNVRYVLLLKKARCDKRRNISGKRVATEAMDFDVSFDHTQDLTEADLTEAVGRHLMVGWPNGVAKNPGDWS